MVPAGIRIGIPCAVSMAQFGQCAVLWLSFGKQLAWALLQLGEVVALAQESIVLTYNISLLMTGFSFSK